MYIRYKTIERESEFVINIYTDSEYVINSITNGH